MTKDEALKLALEALQKIYIAPEHEEYIRVWWPACERAITTIKEALAKPHKQSAERVEPVAIHQFRLMYVADWYDGHPDPEDGYGPYELRTLYTSPPQRKPLTDEQRKAIVSMWKGGNWTAGDIIDAVEAAQGIKE